MTIQAAALEDAPKLAFMSGIAGMISVWPSAKATVPRLRMRRVRWGAARSGSCIRHKLHPRSSNLVATWLLLRQDRRSVDG